MSICSAAVDLDNGYGFGEQWSYTKELSIPEFASQSCFANSALLLHPGVTPDRGNKLHPQRDGYNLRKSMKIFSSGEALPLISTPESVYFFATVPVSQIKWRYV